MASSCSENAGTGPAVADLTYALGFFLSNTWGTEVQHAVYNRGPLRTPELALRLRQAVCRGYLRELGRPAGEEDVFALLLDVERCSLRFSRPAAAYVIRRFSITRRRTAVTLDER